MERLIDKLPVEQRRHIAELLNDNLTPRERLVEEGIRVGYQLAQELPPAEPQPEAPVDPVAVGAEVMFWDSLVAEDGAPGQASHAAIERVWGPKMVNLDNGKTSVAVWRPGDELSPYMGCALVAELGAEFQDRLYALCAARRAEIEAAKAPPPAPDPAPAPPPEGA